VRPIQKELAVVVVQEEEVVEVGVDAGVGLAASFADFAVIVAPQGGEDVGRLEPEGVAELLAADELDPAVDAAGIADRRNAGSELSSPSRPERPGSDRSRRARPSRDS